MAADSVKTSTGDTQSPRTSPRRISIPPAVRALFAVASVVISISIFAAPVEAATSAELTAGNLPAAQIAVTVTPDPPAAQKHLKIVLVCDSDDTRTRGLQGFRPLQTDEAALFVFSPPRKATFWMGTVSYPLDIIFVAPDGRVAKVYAECQPGSMDFFPSIREIAWVLETSAGSGIKAGDRITFSQSMD